MLHLNQKMVGENYVPGANSVSALESYQTGLDALHSNAQTSSQSAFRLPSKQRVKFAKTSNKRMKRSNTLMSITSEITLVDVQEVSQKTTLNKGQYIIDVVWKVSCFLFICAVIAIVTYTLYENIKVEDKLTIENSHIVKETSTSLSVTTTRNTSQRNGKYLLNDTLHCYT